MVAVALALGSSLLWGSADFAGGTLSRRVPVSRVVLLSQAAGALVLLVVCAVVGQPFPHLFWLPMVAGLFGLVGLLFFYRGLAMGKMSLVAPVAGCGVVIPVIYALLIGEIPHPLTMAGLASAIIGVVLASITPARAAERALHPRGAALAALGAAVGFGMFLLLLGRAASLEPGSVLWMSFCTRLASVPALALGVLVTRRAVPWRSTPPADLALIALVGLGDAAANTLFGIANTIGALAVVAVLGSLYPLVTAGLARLRLGERLTSRQKVGAALAMLGVVLVSAS
jgi:drug/metabolite transporter (DMT)-like permease